MITLSIISDLLCFGVSKPFRYNSGKFRYALVTPSISDFFNSASKRLWKSSVPISAGGEYNRTCHFCSSHIGCRRFITMPLKISDQFIYGRLCFLHSLFDITFLYFTINSSQYKTSLIFPRKAEKFKKTGQFRFQNGMNRFCSGQKSAPRRPQRGLSRSA